MNLLKQRVAERLASEPVEETCIRIGAQTPGLVVALWPEESWVLPWSFLLSAHCTKQAGWVMCTSVRALVRFIHF